MNPQIPENDPSDTNDNDARNSESEAMPDLSNVYDPNATVSRDSDPNSKSASTADPIRRRIGPFKILQKIAEGGMGAVYMAEQTEPVRRRVALKIIKAGKDSEQIVIRFEAERQALAMMNHPNIAKVLDVGKTDDGLPYFAMELVKGIPFTEYCDQNKLSIEERLKLFVPVCKAIQHAHQKGVIHRDLKPSNVLIALYDGEPVPKVIDFGLAKAIEHQTRLTDKTMFTEYGQIVGTLQYMSPEQAEMNQLDVDTRTDIYSLGVMLYELLTGTTPLESETTKQNALLKVLELIRETEPPRPSSRLSATTEASTGISKQRRIQLSTLQQILKGELDWIVMKSLEKDRTRRYETASGFAQDIENYLAGDVVIARPPSTAYRFRKYVNKYKGFVASIAAIATLLVTGIMGTTWFAIDAGVAKTKADEKSTEAVKQERIANEKTSEAKLAKNLAVRLANQARKSESAAKFQLANARWDANRVAEARDLLHQIPAEFRENFEWHFCNRRFLGSDMTLYGHTGSVTCVSYSPDGKFIASGSTDNTIKVWDAITGEQISTLEGHTGAVLSLAYSPNSELIASGSSDNTVKIWDPVAGHAIDTFLGHFEEVRRVVFSPDGRLLASSGGDARVKIRKMNSVNGILMPDEHLGSLIRTLWLDHDCDSIEFSPDGTQVVITEQFSDILDVLDLGTGEKIYKSDRHESFITTISICSDGSKIVTGCRNGELWILDANTGRKINKIEAHDATINFVSVSPDGSKIISASDDRLIKMWDLKTGLEISTFKGHTSEVLSLSFSPDGSRFVSGDYDGKIKIWNTTGREDKLSIESQGIHCLSRDSTMLASSKFDVPRSEWSNPDMDQINFDLDYDDRQTVELWNTKTGKMKFAFVGHAKIITSIAFSFDGSLLASGDRAGTLRIWDTKTGQELQILTAQNPNSIYGIAFSPNSKKIAFGNDKTTAVFDVTAGVCNAKIDGFEAFAFTNSFSPDSSKIVSTCFQNGTIKVSDSVTGKELYRVNETDSFKYSYGRAYVSPAFSPDGKRIAAWSQGSTVVVWDAETGKESLKLRGHSNAVTSITFNPRGNRIVTASLDETVKVWDAYSGKELVSIGGRTKPVESLGFNSDGDQFTAVNTSDRPIELFDGSRRHEFTMLRGHKNEVVSISFSDDGTRIHSQSRSEKLVWNATTHQIAANEDWVSRQPARPISPDGRWLVTSEGSNILLVDLEFKNTPGENAYREAKARIDVRWHENQGDDAANLQDWFAESFHYAWAMKAEPKNDRNIESFQNAFSNLECEYSEKGEDVDPILPNIVKEARARIENQ